MAHDGYEPLDAGDGRRLERFGTVVVDRPAPGATSPRRDPVAWDGADARYERDDAGGRWRLREALPEPWLLHIDGLVLELRAASAGQVGVFPEQGPLWSRMRASIAAWSGDSAEAAGPGRSPEILSLFAYTGVATLVCAAAGARVIHVDASRTAIAWARRNAARSGLSDRPIRWIAEDAAAFVAREARRGRRYDGVVLDPPSYGHGTDGRQWRIERDLEPLIGLLHELRSDRPAFVLLSAHTPALDPARLAGSLRGWGDGAVESGPLELVTRSGTRLGLGAFASWTAR